MLRDIQFEVAGEMLRGTLCKATNERAAVLLVAGGGNKPREEGYQAAWQKILLEKGITTFNFDFRGVGDSDRFLTETNLLTRVEDTKAALTILKEHTNTKVFLVGTSMGAPVSIQSADQSVSGLLLLVPAAYSQEARNRNFGPEFSDAIRKPESWKDSPDFEELSKWSGKTFLMYGSADEVIPKEIFQKYQSIVQASEGSVLLLDGATHNSWKTEEREFVLDHLVTFMVEC